MLRFGVVTGMTEARGCVWLAVVGLALASDSRGFAVSERAEIASSKLAEATKDFNALNMHTPKKRPMEFFEYLVYYITNFQ